MFNFGKKTKVNDLGSNLQINKDVVIDEDMISEADNITTNLSLKDRQDRKKIIVEEKSTGAKFGYIKETNPSDFTSGEMFAKNNQNFGTPNDVNFNSLNGDRNSFDSNRTLDFNETNDKNIPPEAKLLSQDFLTEEEIKAKREKRSKTILVTVIILLVLTGIAIVFVVPNIPTIIEKINGTPDNTIVQMTVPDNTEEEHVEKSHMHYVKNKLKEVDPNTIYDVNESSVLINEICVAINEYMIDITDDVKAYRDDYDNRIEEYMSSYQQPLQKDLNVIGTYKEVFKKYGDEDELLFTDFNKRLSNLYFLVNSLKNSMSISEIIEMTNEKINAEKNLAEQTVVDIEEYLKKNNVDYESENGLIVYIPLASADINETQQSGERQESQTIISSVQQVEEVDYDSEATFTD